MKKPRNRSASAETFIKKDGNQRKDEFLKLTKTADGNIALTPRLSRREQEARVLARFEKSLQKAKQIGDRRLQNQQIEAKPAAPSKKAVTEKQKEAVKRRFERDIAKYEKKGNLRKEKAEETGFTKLPKLEEVAIKEDPRVAARMAKEMEKAKRLAEFRKKKMKDEATSAKKLPPVRGTVSAAVQARLDAGIAKAKAKSESRKKKKKKNG